MHADNLKQFTINMETIARYAGYQGLQGNDAGEPPMGICTECGETMSIEELQPEMVCDPCFKEHFIKGTVLEEYI